MNSESIIALVALGISTLISYTIIMFKMGKVFGKIDNLDMKFDSLDNKVDSIDKRLSRLESKVLVLETKMGMIFLQSSYTESHSPMELNEAGKNVLMDSGVRHIVEPYYQQILAAVKAQNPQTAYQVQEILIQELRDYKDKEELRTALEDGAYRSGASLDSVLFVEAIYIRDRVLKDMGFDIADLQTDQPRS